MCLEGLGALRRNEAGSKPAGDTSCVCKCVLRVRAHVGQRHVASHMDLTRQRA